MLGSRFRYIAEFVFVYFLSFGEVHSLRDVLAVCVLFVYGMLLIRINSFIHSFTVHVITYAVGRAYT